MSRPHRFPLAACAAVLAASVGTEILAGSLESCIAERHTLAQIERYCTTSWRNARVPDSEWHDLTQDAFVELLGRLPQETWRTALDAPESEERRELNRSIWCVAQRWRRAPKSRPLAEDAVAVTQAPPTGCDRSSPNGATSAAVDDRTVAVRAALETLSSRQRDVLTRWSRGASIAEISRETGLDAGRVSDAKYKGLRRLRARMEG